MEATERINNLIRQQYNELDERNTVTIAPAHLARAVYDALDPEAHSPLDVQFLCILQLRQMARQICAKRNDEEESQANQGALFEMQLQPRYPAKRDGEDVYVIRAELTLKERRIIIARLEAEASAKARHAEALKAETEDLLKRGVLHEGENAA
jgi:hypothetical protein